MPINNQIINQKGTPAFYSDIFANRPAFGYAGRVFISTDTGAIYEDTGTSWTLIADAGAGTTGTLQQVTTNGNTTTLGIEVQGININDGAGTGLGNTAIGSSNLSVNTTGQYNTAIGFNSLISNISGINNTAVGVSALTGNTTGRYNTAIGNGALTSNTNAEYNTAIGFTSLTLNTTGQYNTSIGESSLSTQTTANNNTAVGSAALTANTSGTPNTAVGRLSLSANTTGGSNTAIGYQSLYLNTTGGSNTAIGVGALQNNTTASTNTAVGSSALQNNTTGTQNTAIGTSALSLNTTAGDNTSIGYAAMQFNTTGTGNTAIGSSSLRANTTFNFNTALGGGALTNALASNNTAVGYGTLQSTTGNNNTAMGVSVLTSNTTGQQNTGIGSSALSGITTGSNNTTIGYSCGNAITTGSNNTIIGNYAGTATLASNIVLSDGAGNVRLFSDANGLIGIGQAVGTPGGQLDIHSTQTYALVLNGLSTSNAYTAFSNASVGKWRIGNTYNAGANSFDIYNLGTSSTALSFNSSTNAGSFVGNVIATTGTTGAAIKLSGFANYGTILDVNDVRRIWFENTGSFRTIFDLPATGTGFEFRTNAGTSLFNLSSSGVGTFSSSITAVRGFFNSGGNSSDPIISITGDTNTGFFFPAADTIAITNGATESMRIISTGEVGIGVTPTAGNKLWVKGTDSTSGNTTLIAQNSSGTNSFYVRNDSAIFFRPSYPFTTAALANMVLDSSGVIQLSVSSLKYKKDINNYDKGLNEVLKLRPVTFKSKNSLTDGDKIFAGFIAEEIDKLGLNEFVIYSQDKTPNALAYSNMTALLTKAIQELNEKLVRNNIN